MDDSGANFEEDGLVTLYVEGSEEPLGKMNVNSITQRLLSNFSNFSAETISLRHRITKEIVVAQPDGSFYFTGHYLVRSYEILGRPTITSTNSDWLTNSFSGQARNGPPRPPSFSNGTIPGAPAFGHMPPAVRSPIVRPKPFMITFQRGYLTEKGRVAPLNIPIEITLMLNEEELNATTINQKLSSEIRQIENQDIIVEYVVCSSRGAAIQDTAATREKSFWINKKNNAKVLWVLPKSTFSDNEENRSSDQAQRQRPSTLDDVHQEVKRVRLEISAASQTITNFLQTAKDEFSCTICTEIVISPVFCNACRKIVACKSCFSRWKSSRNACCLCRAEGESVVEILGLDNVGKTIRALTQSGSPDA